MNLNLYEKILLEVKAAIKIAKAISWQKFCNDVDECSYASDMWSKMRWLKGHKRTKICISQELKQDLLSNLASDSVLVATPKFKSVKVSLQKKFNIQELEQSLKKKDTVPGDDSITYLMIF